MLDIEGNYVEEIDLSQNRELLNVYLRNNLLRSIDFSNNTKLEFIEIFDNRLTSIDLSMLPNLKFVHLDYNQLKVIDVSHNLKLEDDGFVGNNNPLEKVILPNIPGKSFDSFPISELNPLPGYSEVVPQWYTTPDFQEDTLVPISTVQGKISIPFNGQTLYARRTPNTYTIVFDGQGASGTMSPQKRSYDEGMISLPANNFTKPGFTFAGWSLTPQGKVAYVDQQPVSNLAGTKYNNESKTLYAIWKPQQVSTGYLRSQLSTPEQQIYDELVGQLSNLTNPLDPSNVTVTVQDAQLASLDKILFAVHRDHPEYFWIDMSKLSWSEVAPQRYALALKVTGESYFVDGFTAENLSDYRQRFDQTASQIVDSAPKDPVLAVKYFNTWLADHNIYNPAGLGASNFSRTAASALLSNNTSAIGPVCYGYATALKVLLDRAGIENAYIEGFAYNGANGPYGEQHAWNYVKIAGDWFAVDPTWNDPTQSTASALETYLLVGSATVTTSRLPGKETFALNHDASKSPALRYGFTYPVLSPHQSSEVRTQITEIIGKPGRVTGFPADGDLQDGDTVKLWSNLDLTETIHISKSITIDLNGFKITPTNASAFTIDQTSTLTLINTSDRLAEVSTDGMHPIAANNGTLNVSPRIRLKASNQLLASPHPVQVTGHAYPVQTNTAYTIYEVTPPAPLHPTTVERSSIGATRQDLLNFINGQGAPSITWQFILLPGSNTVNIPSEKVPAYTWNFAHTSTRSRRSLDALQTGRYNLVTSVFGYDLSYEVNVVDTQLSTLRETYRDKIQKLEDDFMKKVADSTYLTSDISKGRNWSQTALTKLDALTSEDEMKALIAELETQLASIKSLTYYVDESMNAWNNTYGVNLNHFEVHPVDATSWKTADVLVSNALSPIALSNIISKVNSSLSEAEINTIIAEMNTRFQDSGIITRLSHLEEAATWVQDVVSTLSESKPLSDKAKALLQDYKKTYDQFSSKTKALIALQVYTDLENAIKDAETPVNPDPDPNPTPEPTPQPTPDPAPNPDPDPVIPNPVDPTPQPTPDGDGGSDTTDPSTSGSSEQPSNPDQSGGSTSQNGTAQQGSSQATQPFQKRKTSAQAPKIPRSGDVSATWSAWAGLTSAGAALFSAWSLRKVRTDHKEDADHRGLR